MSKTSKKIDYQEILKVPPHDLEAEQSVLGALMINKMAVIKVVDILSPDDFYKGDHQKIYESALSLYEKRKPIDILSVSSKLKERGLFEEIGGNSYLSDLVNRVPTASHVAHYATIVREKRILRDLISTSFHIAEQAFSSQEEKDLEHLLDNVEQKIFSITQKSVTKDFASLEDEITGAWERIEKLHSGEESITGVPTGFKEFDKRLSGLQKSDLILIGARPSVGKTALALNMALRIAKQDYTIGFFSLEMSRSQIIDRLLATEARVNLQEMRTGKLDMNSGDFGRLSKAVNTLSDLKLFVDDTPSPNILQMRAMARRLQMEHGLDLLVVDYLQLIAPRNPRDNVVQQVTEISRGLKSLARELQVPVVALSQLSRAVDQRGGKPKLYDLRESGSLEQDSDIVVFISRNKEEQEQGGENMADISIAKYRNGATGSFKLVFNPRYASFEDPEYHRNPESYV